MSPDQYRPELKWIDGVHPPRRREINHHAQREARRAKQWSQQHRSRRDEALLARLVGFTRRRGVLNQSSDLRRGQSSSAHDESDLMIYPHSWSGTFRISLAGSLPDALTTSRRDPFQSLPLVRGEVEQVLVDHYIIGMMAMFSKVNQETPSKRILFSLAAAGPLAFSSIVLVFASTHRSRLRGMIESVESTQQKSRAFALLQAKVNEISEGAIPDDDLIAAMFGLASFENQFGSMELALMHTKAVMAFLRTRGKFGVLPHNSKISAYANWVDYTTTTPTCLDDLSLYSSVSTSPDTPSNVAFDTNTCYTDLQDFIQFLFNTEMLSAFQRNLDRRKRHHRQSMFKDGTLLCQLLKGPLGSDSWSTNRIPEYCRMAAMLSLHAALWEHRMSSDSGEHFLSMIDRKVIQYSYALKMNEGAYVIHPNASIGLFVWLMLEMDMDNADQNRRVSSGARQERRSWFVGRVLRVAKLLEYPSWQKLGHILLGQLELADIGPAKLESTEERMMWREDIKAELLKTAISR